MTWLFIVLKVYKYIKKCCAPTKILYRWWTNYREFEISFYHDLPQNAWHGTIEYLNEKRSFKNEMVEEHFPEPFSTCNCCRSYVCAYILYMNGTIKFGALYVPKGFSARAPNELREAILAFPCKNDFKGCLQN